MTIARILDDAVALLNVVNNSSDLYKIMSLANEMTRSEFKNKAFIFA